MSREGTFAIYCLERYRRAKSLSGREAVRLFAAYGVIAYLRKFFESLHVVSERLILEDIDAFLTRQGAKREGVEFLTRRHGEG